MPEVDPGGPWVGDQPGPVRLHGRLTLLERVTDRDEDVGASGITLWV